jgi:hypothetical protein
VAQNLKFKIDYRFDWMGIPKGAGIAMPVMMAAFNKTVDDNARSPHSLLPKL